MRKAAEVARSLDHTTRVLVESPTANADDVASRESAEALKLEAEKHEVRMASLWEENADIMNQFTRDELLELSAITADPLRYRPKD